MATSTAMSLTATLYVGVTALYAAYLLTLRERWLEIARVSLGVAVLGQLAAMSYAAGQSGGWPFLAGRGLPAILVGALVGVFFATRLWRRLPLAGAFLAPLAAVLLYAAALGHGATPAGGLDAMQPLAWLHIIPSMLGFVGLTVSFAWAVLYVLQDLQLRRKQMSPWLKRLPPLQVIERRMVRWLVAGFILFTLGSALGAVWLGENFPQEGLEPQHTLALLSWGLLAVWLGVRVATGWTGRRAAMLLVLAYLGTVAVVTLYYLRSVQG